MADNLLSSLPILIIGAGPIGLAAAAKCVRRGLNFLVLEAGARPAWTVRQWRHVRLFSPWEDCLDSDGAALLTEMGRPLPDPQVYPTGAELVDSYLAPLADHPAIHSRLRLSTRVVRCARRGLEKHSARTRFETPFVATTADGDEILGRSIIDASGNWHMQRRLPGAAGTETELIRYCMPDLDRREETAIVEGKRVLVIGAGHSGMTTILNLAARGSTERIIWVRRSAGVPGAKTNPQGSARLALEARAEELVASGLVEQLFGVSVTFLGEGHGVVVAGCEDQHGHSGKIEADIAFVATGFRPDLSLAADLWVATDHRWEAPAKLADLIDPDKHSCNSVPTHGAAELAHPERDFFIAGAKSYGRAPNFSLIAGYAQIDSILDWLQTEPAVRTEPASACSPCSG